MFTVRDIYIRATQRLVEGNDAITLIKDDATVNFHIPPGNYTINELVSVLNSFSTVNSLSINFVYDPVSMRVRITSPKSKKISLCMSKLTNALGFRSRERVLHSSVNYIEGTACPNMDANEPIELFIDELSDSPICLVHFDSDGVGFIRKQFVNTCNNAKDIKAFTVRLVNAFSKKKYETHGCDFLFALSCFTN